MKSKTQIAKNLFEAGDLKAALKIVKDFRMGITAQQKKALALGYEAIVHPSFYVQLKKDPVQLIAEAKVVLGAFFQEAA